jgi:hypothetical protein
LIALAAGLAFLFQDTIGLALINPNRSYEAYTPPPPPDYGTDAAWHRRADGEGPVDVFVIHSNAYRGDGNWNAPYDRETQLDFVEGGLLPVEAGPFESFGPVWIPRYRQPTLYARFTQKHPGSAARVTAYADIRAAFDAFLRDREDGRPFIVAGYGDGALFAGRLFEERIAPNATLRQALAAVYAIGMPLPKDLMEDGLCERPGEPRCLVAFAPVDRRFHRYQTRLAERTLTLAPEGGYRSTSGTELVCAPPSLPRRTEAVFAEEGRPMALEIRLKASCENGLLLVDPPADERLRQRRFFGLQWRPAPVNLFYRPLEEDAERRILSVARRMATEGSAVPPMAVPEDVEPAVINTIPG